MIPTKRIKPEYLLVLAIVVLAVVLLMCACNGPYYRQPVVVQAQPVAQQAVANNQDFQIVQDPNSGIEYSIFMAAGVQYMIDLDTWNTWYGMGGYNYVLGHYRSYGYCTPYYADRYSFRTINHYSYNTYRSSYARSPRAFSPAYRPQMRSSAPRPSMQSTRASTRPTMQSSSAPRSYSPASRPSMSSTRSSSRPSMRH